MNKELWMVLIATASGTFLMRCLPLLYMQRHLEKRRDDETDGAMPAWLSVLGPSMIAAMLGTSLIPSAGNASSWLATVFGLIATYCTWRRTRSLGWPILVGVFVFGVLNVLLPGLLPI
jgi:branched-subunit amino acid transport protein